MRRFCLTLTFLSAFLSFSIAQKQYQLKSPNGKLELILFLSYTKTQECTQKCKCQTKSSHKSILLV